MPTNNTDTDTNNPNSTTSTMEEEARIAFVCAEEAESNGDISGATKLYKRAYRLNPSLEFTPQSAAQTETQMEMILTEMVETLTDRKEIKVDTYWSHLLEVEEEEDTSSTQKHQTLPRPLATDEAIQHYGNGENDKLIVLANILTEKECIRLNQAAEDIGYGRTGYDPSYRGNLRLIATDVGLAKILWDRLRPFLPPTMEVVDRPDGRSSSTWEAIGLNECFRLAKYYPGHSFGAHVDSNFRRHAEEMSLYTVNIYTNSVPSEHGGRTRFYNKSKSKRRRSCCSEEDVDFYAQPEAGLGVLFQQPPIEYLVHDGEELKGGLKYLLRTDVMYRRRSINS